MNQFVSYKDSKYKEKAELLGQRLGLFCLQQNSIKESEEETLIVFLGDEGLELNLLEGKKKLSLKIDFSQIYEEFKKRNYFSKNNILLKACGLPTQLDRKGSGKSKVVWDLTAGLGKDALLFASVGCQVLARERSSIVYELLCDAKKMGMEIEEIASVLSRIEFFWEDSLLLLSVEKIETSSLSSRVEYLSSPDVIYIDPMYPEKKKKSLPKKEMQVFQKVLGHNEEGIEDEAFELLIRAMKFPNARIVVKRPVWSKAISTKEVSLSHSFLGKTVRYDMYLT